MNVIKQYCEKQEYQINGEIDHVLGMKDLKNMLISLKLIHRSHAISIKFLVDFLLWKLKI